MEFEQLNRQGKYTPAEAIKIARGELAQALEREMANLQSHEREAARHRANVTRLESELLDFDNWLKQNN